MGSDTVRIPAAFPLTATTNVVCPSACNEVGVYDISNPKTPEATFIQIALLADPKFKRPRITELRVHFDETGYNTLTIHGDRLKERYLGSVGGRRHIGYYCSVADTDELRDAVAKPIETAKPK